MWAAILEAVLGLIKAIPILDRWFTKPTAQKVEEAKEGARGALDHAKETGRPQW